jgi:hypothetical protein
MRFVRWRDSGAADAPPLAAARALLALGRHER